jgi:hypothetical protein
MFPLIGLLVNSGLMQTALAKGVVTAMITYTSHYVATKVYDNYCIPDGFWGYFAGIAATGSPLCQATLQIVTTSQSAFGSFILMGLSRMVVDLVVPVSGTVNGNGIEIPK